LPGSTILIAEERMPRSAITTPAVLRMPDILLIAMLFVGLAMPRTKRVMPRKIKRLMMFRGLAFEISRECSLINIVDNGQKDDLVFPIVFRLPTSLLRFFFGLRPVLLMELLPSR